MTEQTRQAMQYAADAGWWRTKAQFVALHGQSIWDALVLASHIEEGVRGRIDLTAAGAAALRAA